MAGSDYEWLTDTNLRMSEAEESGDRRFFDELLAGAFAFRRASGSVVDRAQFIADLEKSQARPTRIESITFFGEARALVTCIVQMKVDGQDRSFHNIRLFVRDAEKRWKLLGWANDAI